MQFSLRLISIFFFLNLAVPLKAQSDDSRIVGLHDNLPIFLISDGESTKLEINGSILAKRSLPLKIPGNTVIFSPNGKIGACLIVRVENDNKSGNFRIQESNHAGVQVFRLSESGWVADEALLWTALPRGYRWIGEIGSINNQGDTILAKFGKLYKYQNKTLILHQWETRNLSWKLLSEGLSISE